MDILVYSKALLILDDFTLILGALLPHRGKSVLVLIITLFTCLKSCLSLLLKL